MHLTAPLNEKQRLQVLRAYDILDSAPEEMFDEVTALIAAICEAPIALVSLLDESRQWFKSRIGVSQQELPREATTFCSHLLHGGELLVVPDALADDRFSLHPLVQGPPHIRFYAGAPLLSPEGAVLGTLCVLDLIPRELSELQEHALRVHSRQIMRQIQMRRDPQNLRPARQALAALRENESEQRMLAARLEVSRQAGGIGSWVVNVPTYETEWSEEVHRLFGTDPSIHSSYESFMQRVHPDDVEIVDEMFKDSIRGGTHGSFVHRMVMSDGLVKHIEQRWQTLRDDSGRPYQAIGTSQDVTARVLTEFRLQRLNRLYAASTPSPAGSMRRSCGSATRKCSMRRPAASLWKRAACSWPGWAPRAWRARRCIPWPFMAMTQAI